MSFEVGDLWSVILAWNSRDLGAATEIPISSAVSFIERSRNSRELTTSQKAARRFLCPVLATSTRLLSADSLISPLHYAGSGTRTHH